MNKRACKSVLVTGGSGFIGSNFIRWLLARPEFDGTVINVDCLTYAGNPHSLQDVEAAFGGSRYFFEQCDIRDAAALQQVFDRYPVDTVVHFAAESHVDRSIVSPQDFIMTNVVGTFNILEAVRRAQYPVHLHHVSTDEVYGSLGPEGLFTEETPYDPRSPYSASKASSDHLVRAYSHTYSLSVTLSNCSNNYGPYQFPEKLIPVMLLNMLEGKPLPVYGDGSNIRDWLYVDDHCSGIWAILQSGSSGATYNIGGDNEIRNIDLVHILCRKLAGLRGESMDKYAALITYVKDRPGHDRRYAIDCTRIKQELGWRQQEVFETGIEKTIRWYLDNSQWVESIRSGEYLTWIEKNYTNR